MYQYTIPLLAVSTFAVVGMTKTLWQTYTIQKPSVVFTEQINRVSFWQKIKHWRGFFVGVMGFFHAIHQAVVPNKDDGVLVIDSNGHVVAANVPSKQMLPPQWLLRSLIDIYPNMPVNLATVARQPFEIEINDAFYQVTMRPFYNWRRRPLGCALIFHDITAKKKAAYLKQEMMQAMIHDLRSPLTNTLSALQMFQQDGGDLAEQTNQLLLGMMVSNTERTLAMVDSLLSIDQLASNTEMRLKRTHIVIPDLVNKMFQTQLARAQQKNIKLHNDLLPTMPLVYGDEKLLGRVVQNLIDNSIKFCHQGAEIRIISRRSSPDWVELTIEDNGPGIPLEQQSAIFDKFVTGDMPASGTGIGLAFCQAVVAAHKGQIWVESTPDKGTKFSFTLPLVY